MPEARAPVHEYGGIRYHVHEQVYEPHDDTWLLVDFVQAGDWDGRRVLEVGCGAGLAVLAAVDKGAFGIGSDRNPEAVRLFRSNAALNGLHDVEGVLADLVSPFDPGTIDVVLFNPPYLPVDPDLPVSGPLAYALEGGPSGDEVIDRFLSHLEEWARRGSRIPEVVLVLSNHNDAGMVRRRLAALGLDRVESGEPRRWFFHRIWVERHHRSGSA